jgi:hypothetical protein
MYAAVRKAGRATKSGGEMGEYSGIKRGTRAGGMEGEFQVLGTKELEKMVGGRSNGPGT